jgi:DNA polymerase-3 subunit delta'
MYPWLNPIFDKLQQRALTQHLHHGLLFVADQGVGEQELVDTLAKSLLCSTKNACGHCKACKLFSAQSHPDLKRVISDKPSIGVDLIRQVSEFVTSTSQMLGNKVVIIANIESMTESASNSLLKTLEEPSQNTYILLSTTKPNTLLATITSRCEKIRLPLPSSEEGLAWLALQTTAAISVEGLSAFSGSPIDYLASLNTESSAYETFSEDLEQLLQGKVSELLLAEKSKTEATVVLSWVYQKAVLLFKKSIETAVTSPPNQAQWLSQQAEKLVYDCEQANKKINQAGINKSLILQQILHKYKALATFKSV